VNVAITEKNKQIKDTEAEITRLRTQIEDAKQSVDALTKEVCPAQQPRLVHWPDA